MKIIQETYKQIKQRHQNELNDFQGIFFAFNNQQFFKGMAKVGLKPEETSEIYRLPGGGFILKSRDHAFKDMFKRHAQEMKEARKANKFLLESLVYELINHEYCITYDPTDALESLGLEEAEITTGMLKKAIKIALERTAQ